VFFERPLEVAREGKSADEVHPRRPADHPDGEPVATAVVLRSPATEGAPPSSPGVWIDLIAGDDLADETKAIRARILDRLQSIGKYNAGYKELRQDAATLAALAAIAIEHPDPPGWRRHAKHVRDVAAEIAAAATALGDRNYQPARSASNQLEALLSGNAPGDLKESGEHTPISVLSTRVPLMYRIERAFNWMKRTVNTESQLRKESSKLAHEGAMLAALARVIADKGFPDADLDDYRAYSAELSQGGLAVVRAAQESDYRAYTAGLDRCGKACTGCHQDFKNN
jgi:hypothetical protein